MTRDASIPDDNVSRQTLLEWNTKLADTIATLGTERFPGHLVDAIEVVVPFKYAFLFLYRPKSRPVHLFSTIRTERARRAIDRFLETTYVLNPVYNAFLVGVESGVHRITDLAPDAYFSSEVHTNLNAVVIEDEELGYRTPGWPEGQEELLALVRLAHGEMLELSLTRSRSVGFSDACADRLRALLPVVERLLALHMAKVRTEVPGIGQVPVLDQLIGAFGKGALTNREQEVAQLVLKGHSSEAIALSLGVSLPTVKTHRQNLYAKLGISTQQELFNLFLKSIPQITDQPD